MAKAFRSMGRIRRSLLFMLKGIGALAITVVIGIVIAMVVSPPPPPTVDYFAASDALYAPHRDKSPEAAAALAAFVASITIEGRMALEFDPMRQAQQEAGLMPVVLQGRTYEPLIDYMDLHEDSDSLAVFGIEPEVYMAWQRRARELMVENYRRSEVRLRLLEMASYPEAGLLTERSGPSVFHSLQLDLNKLLSPMKFERVVMEEAARTGQADMLLESVDAVLTLARLADRSAGLGPSIARAIHIRLLLILRALISDDSIDAPMAMAILARLEAFERDRVPHRVFAQQLHLHALDNMQYLYGRVGADELAGIQPVPWWIKHAPTTWALHREGHAVVMDRQPLVEALLEAGPAAFPNAYDAFVLWTDGLNEDQFLWATMDLELLIVHTRRLGEERADSVATRVMLAMAAYRHDHGGAWPEELKGLVPRYLAALPDDPDAPSPGMPLRYEYEAGAGPRLWTRGEDSVDDGGTPLAPKPGRAPAWEPRQGDRVYLPAS